MTNYLKVDAENRRLIMDKTFSKNAMIVGSTEYNMLQAARKDYACYAVVTRQIKRNPNKECYNGLNCFPGDEGFAELNSAERKALTQKAFADLAFIFDDLEW